MIQDSLFEGPTVDDSLRDRRSTCREEWVEVDTRRVYTERSRRFGDVWLALELLKKIGLTELFERLMSSEHPKILWSAIAEVLV